MEQEFTTKDLIELHKQTLELLRETLEVLKKINAPIYVTPFREPLPVQVPSPAPWSPQPSIPYIPAYPYITCQNSKKEPVFLTGMTEVRNHVSESD
jgi:hypothetical protein